MSQGSPTVGRLSEDTIENVSQLTRKYLSMSTGRRWLWASINWMVGGCISGKILGSSSSSIHPSDMNIRQKALKNIKSACMNECMWYVVAEKCYRRTSPFPIYLILGRITTFVWLLSLMIHVSVSEASYGKKLSWVSWTCFIVQVPWATIELLEENYKLCHQVTLKIQWEHEFSCVPAAMNVFTDYKWTTHLIWL